MICILPTVFFGVFNKLKIHFGAMCNPNCCRFIAQHSKIVKYHQTSPRMLFSCDPLKNKNKNTNHFVFILGRSCGVGALCLEFCMVLMTIFFLFHVSQPAASLFMADEMETTLWPSQFKNTTWLMSFSINQFCIFFMVDEIESILWL